MRTRKKILCTVVVAIIGLNFFIQDNTNQPDRDLNTLSNIAMASGEEDPDEGDPIYKPTGLIDWLGELIGF